MWEQKKRISEINITPFIDVMLVLLIIFMATSSVMMPTLKVDLPKAKTSNQESAVTQKSITITINPSGKIYFQDDLVTLQELSTKILAEDTNNRIFIVGDKTIDYGSVIQVMGVVNSAGFNKVALVTNSERN